MQHSLGHWGRREEGGPEVTRARRWFGWAWRDWDALFGRSTVELMIGVCLADRRCGWNISIWSSVIITRRVSLCCLSHIGEATPCSKRANLVAEKETMACHLGDNKGLRSPDTTATQRILLNRAHDESGPWCSLLSKWQQQGEGAQGLSTFRSGVVRKLYIRNQACV